VVVTIQLSREAFERLQAEFDDMYGRGRIEIAKRIEAARELGDLSENGEYHAAKEEQGKMDARMKQIRGLLDDVEIVDSVDTSKVSSGAVVTIRYDGETGTETYLLGTIEERREGIDVMSPTSPMGSALLGHKVGDTVQYQAPGGKITVEVVAITA
jgi:transcription elongation factor GreA